MAFIVLLCHHVSGVSLSTWWFISGPSEMYKILNVLFNVTLLQGLPHLLVQLRTRTRKERESSKGTAGVEG